MKWYCTVCGYVHEGAEPPEQCPVCKQPASKFKKMEEDAVKVLDQSNINAFTIYPDIIGLARSLRYDDSQFKGI